MVEGTDFRWTRDEMGSFGSGENWVRIDRVRQMWSVSSVIPSTGVVGVKCLGRTSNETVCSQHHNC